MAYLFYKWVHPEGEWWTCAFRRFDEWTKNVEVRLKIPIIKWPKHKEEIGREYLIPGPEICKRAVDAVDRWAPLVREKANGEQFQFHQALTCIIQMHETLLHCVNTLPTRSDHLRLFYGAAADRILELSEVTSVELHKELPRVVTLEPNGMFKITGFPEYKARLSYAEE